MARSCIVAGNWKMYKTAPEGQEFVEKLKEFLSEEGIAERLEEIDLSMYLAVPFTALQGCVESSEGTSIRIGAQNMHDATEGAFTGEIASEMLLSAGAQFVILGHSERRHVFGEENGFVNRKVHRALDSGLQPILCIGETLEQREADQMQEVLRSQILESLAGVEKEQISEVVLAYEPVWAIGTGRTATEEQAQEAHEFCREVLGEQWGKRKAGSISILYGGSVKPTNAKGLLKQKDVDGVLVGGASLDPESFIGIVRESLGTKKKRRKKVVVAESED